MKKLYERLITTAGIAILIGSRSFMADLFATYPIYGIILNVIPILLLQDFW
jgi:hypothetical protein